MISNYQILLLFRCFLRPREHLCPRANYKEKNQTQIGGHTEGNTWLPVLLKKVKIIKNKGGLTDLENEPAIAEGKDRGNLV